MVVLSIAVTIMLCIFMPVHCIDTSVKGDKCSKLDLCKSGGSDAFRTCACDEDCHKYGTCCVDAHNFELMSSQKAEYQCYEDKMATAVFAKRTCADKFSVHVSHRNACLGAEPDKNDVIGNLLVTSSRTKVTYWNKECAMCNNEAANDLKLWSVQVTCPSKFEGLGISEKYIHDNLVLNWEEGEWGLNIFDKFLKCSISLLPPSNHAENLRHCAKNVITSCPLNFSNTGIAERCSKYHGQRRQKGTNNYFKNVHCALCNGVDLKELDCAGRNYNPTGFHGGLDIVNIVFKDSQWLERLGQERYKCSEYFTYDPFWEKCRRVFWPIMEQEKEDLITNSGEMTRATFFILIISLFMTNKIFC